MFGRRQGSRDETAKADMVVLHFREDGSLAGAQLILKGGPAEVSPPEDAKYGVLVGTPLAVVESPFWKDSQAA